MKLRALERVMELVGVHCFRQGGTVNCLISARLAGKKERKTYEEKKK